jgi:hypothetical protein
MSDPTLRHFAFMASSTTSSVRAASTSYCLIIAPSLNAGCDGWFGKAANAEAYSSPKKCSGRAPDHRFSASSTLTDARPLTGMPARCSKSAIAALLLVPMSPSGWPPTS